MVGYTSVGLEEAFIYSGWVFYILLSCLPLAQPREVDVATETCVFLNPGAG